MYRLHFTRVEFVDSSHQQADLEGGVWQYPTLLHNQGQLVASNCNEICRINHIIQNTRKITRRHRVRLASPQVPNERACFSLRACSLNQYGMGTFQSDRHRDPAIDRQANGPGKIRQESQHHFVMDPTRHARQIQKSKDAILQVACRVNESLAVALR